MDEGYGIQPLHEQKGRTISHFIPASIQPLLLPVEIEQYLQKLEGNPPDWTQLHHSDLAEQSERLFQYNRQQDSARENKTLLLKQPIAFIWSGFLRQYLTEFQGFTLALGPELTNTSWGLIRFKPIDLPDYVVAVPSIELRKSLLMRQKRGEHIEVMVVCIGTIISNESLIYAFSHEDHQKGMILPVVSIQSLIYLLKS